MSPNDTISEESETSQNTVLFKPRKKKSSKLRVPVLRESGSVKNTLALIKKNSSKIKAYRSQSSSSINISQDRSI